MSTYRIDEKFVKDSIITEGKVDFDRSQAQKNHVRDIRSSTLKKSLSMRSLLKNVKKV